MIKNIGTMTFVIKNEKEPKIKRVFAKVHWDTETEEITSNETHIGTAPNLNNAKARCFAWAKKTGNYFELSKFEKKQITKRPPRYQRNNKKIKKDYPHTFDI